MALSDVQIRNAKPKEKPYKIADGEGLHILITPNGSRLWRLKYRVGGIEKQLAIGPYPQVSLKEARDKRDEAKRSLRSGIDPSQAKKAQKVSAAGADSFEAIAREWYEKFAPTKTPSHNEKIIRLLDRDIFPWLGKLPIKEVTAPELLSVLRRIEARGAIDTAHRASQICGQIFRYAIATGRAERDLSQDIKGAIPPPRRKHRASIIEPKEVGQLLRAIDGYKGGIVVRSAFRLAPLVFLRPGELRHLEWEEIHFDKKEIHIPGPKMKMKEKHIVPLSNQAIEILEEVQAVTGQGRYVFPSPRTWERPMSENAILVALRTLGYANDQMTGHGFRSMASTLLNEQGWNRDAIERQLAHAERDNIRAAYNYAQHLPERRKMMQAWADYLDALKEGGEVIPFRKSENL